MSDHPIYQLVYISTYSMARVDNGLHALRDILKTSRRNNAEQEITGYLIFDGETFLQVLEGAKDAVIATYERIRTDDRHRDAHVIGARRAAMRDFAGWTMAGYLRGPRDTEIFQRHDIIGPLASIAFTPETAIALARDLAASRTGAV